jgi:hypothetical protein
MRCFVIAISPVGPAPEQAECFARRRGQDDVRPPREIAYLDIEYVLTDVRFEALGKIYAQDFVTTILECRTPATKS